MLDINEEKPNSTCLFKPILVCINSYFEYPICHYTKLLSASSCVYIIVESVSKKSFLTSLYWCYIFIFFFPGIGYFFFLNHEILFKRWCKYNFLRYSLSMRTCGLRKFSYIAGHKRFFPLQILMMLLLN